MYVISSSEDSAMNLTSQHQPRSSADVTFRLAMKSDFDFLFAGYLNVHQLENHGAHYTEEQHAGRVAMLRDKAEKGTAFVAVRPSDGSSVGFIAFDLVTQFPFGFNYGDFGKGTYMWVSLVFVTESGRGSGIGKQLYAELERHAKDIGVREIYLDVFASNTRSAHFHEQLGFSPEVSIYRKQIT